MIQATIIGKNKEETLLIPEGWNELNPGQLVELSGIILSEHDRIVRRIRTIRLLTDQKLKSFRRFDAVVMQEDLFPLVSWTESEEIKFTSQLLPEIQLEKDILYGPKEALSNIRLSEWDFAERALVDWYDDKGKPEHLARLVAILYRPGKKDYDRQRDEAGDIREPFNDNLVDYHAARIMAAVPVAVQFAVLLWYRGCRNFITGSYSYIFKGGNGSGKSNSPAGYFDLMRAIAKEGTYGDFEKVEQLYLYNALYELKCSHEEAEKQKKDLEKQKRRR